MEIGARLLPGRGELDPVEGLSGWEKAWDLRAANQNEGGNLSATTTRTARLVAAEGLSCWKNAREGVVEITKADGNPSQATSL